MNTESLISWIPQLMIFTFMIVLGASAIYGLYWAAKNGQFQRLDDASKSIFDKDEKIGQVTDSFPDDGKTKSAKKS